MAQLRDLIAQALVGNGQFPWGIRVVETGAMDPDSALPPVGEQPWLLIRNVGSLVDLNRVETNLYEISVYGSNTSFAVMDVLEKLVVGILNRTVLVDTDVQPYQRYTLAYAGTIMGDQVVPAWDAYVRTLRFNASGTAAWYAPDDPRAEYLRSITPYLLLCTTTVGIDWTCVQTDPKTWVPTDACPGVYWRPFTGPSEVIRWFEMTQYVEIIAGHVVAASSAAQDAWVDRVALALPGHVLWNDTLNRRQSTMLLRLLSTDINADALGVGQIRLEVRWTELRCPAPPDYPPVRQITVKEVPSYVGSGIPNPGQPMPPLRTPQEVPSRDSIAPAASNPAPFANTLARAHAATRANGSDAASSGKASRRARKERVLSQ